MKFSCDIFPIKIWLDIEEDGKEGNAGIVIKGDSSSANITLYRKTIENWRSTLLHEVIHAVSHCLRKIGIEHSEETEEVYTYCIEYFYMKIVKRIEKDKLF